MHSSVIQRFAAAVTVAVAALLAVPASGEELKIAVAADVTSIDPHFFNLFPNNNIAEHIFDKLVQMDPDSQMIPGLATSWKTIDDKTWEFKLRKGVKFHDGSELTAEDVAFSIDRVPKVPNSPGPFTAYTKAIIGKEIVDPVHDPLQVRGAVSARAQRPVDDLHRVEEGRDRRVDRGLQLAARRRSAAAATSSSATSTAIASSSSRNDDYWGDKPLLAEGHVQDHQERGGARGGAAVRRRRRDRAAANRRPRADQGRPASSRSRRRSRIASSTSISITSIGRARSSPARTASRSPRTRCSIARVRHAISQGDQPAGDRRARDGRPGDSVGPARVRASCSATCRA